MPWVKGHVLYSDVDRSPSHPSVLVLMSIATTGVVCLLILSALLAYPTARLTHAVVQFDQNLLRLLNRVAGRSWGFDVLVWEVAHTVFLQALMVAVFWGLWFAPSDDPSIRRRKRATMLTSLVGLYLTVVLAIVLRAVLPFRSRPCSDPTLVFQAPFSPSGDGVHASSTSFPAGHAAVFFALAIGLWVVSARLGILASLHALLVICVPRIYIGLHYPTDILAGALIGIVTVLLVNQILSRNSLVSRVLEWSERHPAAFGALLFLCCLEIAVEFSSIRGLLRMLQSSHINKLVLLPFGVS
ncbi:MAG: hypothetical protein DME04_17500 [Candidatus Rokuibacteriota bacterium]|nr:MAG: hypothetical protein DME04_17500 [Candidatus Rokubacteria bacterium]